MADLKIKILGDDSSLKRALKGASNRINAFGSKMAGAFRASARSLGVVVGAIAGAAYAITKLGADFEQTSVAFSTMLRSGDKASAMLEKLTEFSTKTPFKPDEVFAAAKTLLAFGASANEVHGIIATIGDVSSATGKDLNELAKIYGKVFVKGKIQAEELNQMSEAGVPIIKELQKMYGATAEEIFKMGSQGKLSFEDMDAALKNMTSDGGIFFNAMVAQSETFNGKMSTLWGNVQELGRALSKLEFPKTLLDQANEIVKTLATELSTSADPTSEQTMLGEIGSWFTERQELATGKAFDGKDAASIAQQGKLDVIASAAQKKREKQAAEDAEAAARKEEAAARLGQMGSAQSLLSKGVLGGGGTLASLGGDISGGGFAARNTVDQEQLDVLKNILKMQEGFIKAAYDDVNQGVTDYWKNEITNTFEG